MPTKQVHFNPLAVQIRYAFHALRDKADQQAGFALRQALTGPVFWVRQWRRRAENRAALAARIERWIND